MKSEPIPNTINTSFNNNSTFYSDKTMPEYFLFTLRCITRLQITVGHRTTVR